MNKNLKIYIAGHNGLVGSACLRNLISKGFKNIIYRSSNELDLRNQEKVFEFISSEKPDIIINNDFKKSIKFLSKETLFKINKHIKS